MAPDLGLYCLPIPITWVSKHELSKLKLGKAVQFVTVRPNFTSELQLTSPWFTLL